MFNSKGMCMFNSKRILGFLKKIGCFLSLIILLTIWTNSIVGMKAKEEKIVTVQHKKVEQLWNTEEIRENLCI